MRRYLAMPTVNLRLINRCLTIIVIVLAVYIIATPFLPALNWWVRHDTPVRAIAPPVNLSPVARGDQQPAITGDVLVVPSIDMEESIHEGATTRTLEYGAWRLPYTSTPDKGSNTVIAGHRFTYVNPKGVFYYLDKIQVGDPITVYWQGKRYEYVVTSSSVVPPSDISVEAATPTSRLTLYTCTPLWTSKSRLIIVAELRKVAE